jgi:hypothetical protein
MRTFLFLAFGMIAAIPAAAAEAEVEQASAPQYTPYKVVFRPEIESPEIGREALVSIRLVISAEGLPVQISIDEEKSFYNEAFKKAALNYVQGMRFEPARLDGKAVEAGPVIQRVVFRTFGQGETDFVTDEFRYELNKVGRLLQKKDYAGANVHAEWMLREKVTLQYEFAVLQAQLAQTHATVGHVDEALRAAAAATVSKATDMPGFKLRRPVPRNDPRNYLLPQELVVFLLELRMQLEASKGEVLTALRTYEELAGLKKIKPEDKSAALAEKLAGLLESGRPLGMGGKVVKEFWSHDQYHPAFTVTNVKGKIDLFHAHCRGSFHEYAYVESRTWTLPPGEESCVVEVYGDPGTTFTFVEMPAVAGAAATP